MKKALHIMICFLLCVMVGACDTKAKSWNHKETYQFGNDMKIKLKGIVMDKQVDPTNLNDEYQYWFTEDKGYQLIDIQFYVENHSNKKQDLNEFYKADLQVEDESLEQDLCMELENYTVIDRETKLAAKEKTIMHQFFYVKEKDLKKDLRALITLDDQDYSLKIEEMKAEVIELEKAKTVELDHMNFTIQSSSVASVIPPITPSDNSTYYFAQGDNQYAGVYAIIENTGKEPLVLQNKYCVTFEENNELIYAWTTILNKEATDFTQDIEIAPGDSRYVLFFCEVPSPNASKTYHVNLTIEGVPYHYSYEHTQIQ